MTNYLFQLRFIIPFLGLLFLNISANAQKLERISARELQALLNDPSDTLHVVNFWATWCKPCVKELPYFGQLQQQFKGRNLKVTLVSLDFPQDIETRLRPFIDKNKIGPPVKVVDDPDQNKWINLVNPAWGGAIPATVVYNKTRNIYQFLEKELTLEELTALINTNL
jgi:thiol-disulfide isomerase/thioredoxin